MLALNYKVTSLASLPQVAADFDATHIASLIDLDMSPLPGSDRPSWLTLHMHDLDKIDDGTLRGNPSAFHVDHLLNFADALPSDARVVFHCVAGRRRSAAAALICDLAFRLQGGATIDGQLISLCIKDLRDRRPQADPNRALLSLADVALDLDGLLRNFPLPPRVLDLSTDAPID